jgi:hypothetical protein
MKKFIIFLFIISNSPLLAQQFCYEDKDHDGYGDPSTQVANTIFGCPLGSWVNNGLDCNDNDANINPNTKWYKDLDNDDFSDSVNTLTQCDQPTGYKRFVDQGKDCDDNDRYATWEPANWYYDPDRDDYIDFYLDPFISAVCRPVGYAHYNEISLHLLLVDCNQNDPLEHPNQQWYPDNDGDGYRASTTPLVQCSRPPGYKAASEFNNLDIDCDDSDAVLNPGSVWYRDLDNDGYSDGGTLVQCTQPTGYKSSVSQGTDCNDSDPILHPNQVWFLDSDGDGHGYGFSFVLQCMRPDGRFALSELLSNADCNDNDALVHDPATVWYRDADNDGYSDGTTLAQCNRPNGYKLISELTATSVDCFDNNVLLIFPLVWHKDADNDGYSDGTTLAQCTRPPGYKYGGSNPLLFPLGDGLIATSGDCNDNNANINPTTIWYKDADNDGHSDGTTITQCLRPTGYKLVSELTATSGDCSDDSPFIILPLVWHKDADNDGYSDGTTLTQCTRPTGYKFGGSNPILFPLGDGLVATSGDCNDNNAILNPATTWYRDADNDGYSNGATLTQCTRPANHKLASELTSISGDCNDNNAMLNPASTWYKDADNDGYSNGATQTQCARPANHKLAAELTSTSGDCNDTDPTVNPASVEVCSNNKDDNCNGVQNEAGCYTCGNATSFSTANITNNSATLNWVSIPHPNHWQLQYKSTAPGTKWIDVTPDPAGNQRSVTINGLTPNKNYLWHIKAKCGNGWTSYSVSIPFTTAGGATTRSQTNTNAEMEATEVDIESLQVKATPNPSNTSFRITLNSNNLKEPVKLIITDMLGRVIETRTTNAGQIIIGEKYRSGTYLVRIIQGKETRQLKLIKLPD